MEEIRGEWRMVQKWKERMEVVGPGRRLAGGVWQDFVEISGAGAGKEVA